MLNLEGIENSEYNNAGALFGVDENGMTEELLGALAKIKNPVKKAKIIQKLAAPPIPSKGSRAEMEKHFVELPGHVKEQLKKGDLRLADTLVYAIKPLSSKTIKMFEPQDTRKIGLRSLSEGKLPKNAVLLVSGIIMLAGTAAGASEDEAMSATYGKIESFPAIALGEFSLKANKKIIVPEGTGNRVFATEANHNVPLGYYKLANPRLIQDDVAIELTVELGTTTGIAANSYLFMALHGTITTP
ncbi:MAG: hypothetical protein AB1458_12070 [Bacteroidota bacterium]